MPSGLMNTSDVLERLAKLATFIEAPNHAEHPYNDGDPDWPTVERSPATRALMDAGFVLEFVEGVIPQLVLNARSDGETWAQIGESLGMTRQAAQQRFGR